MGQSFGGLIAFLVLVGISVTVVTGGVCHWGAFVLVVVVMAIFARALGGR